jgi:uncharacterized membrane protein (UPF0127 family)
VRLVRATNQRSMVLGDRIAVADRWWPRFRGLLGRPELAPGEGLLLRPCRAVHMMGMRFPLDVAFVDQDGIVVAAYPNLRPGARTRWHRRAQGALELPAGTLAASGTREGDQIVCTEEPHP